MSRQTDEGCTHLCTYRPKAGRSGNGNSPARDAAILFIVCLAAWVFIERTEICTLFFAFVAANPNLKLDSVILAGMFAAGGLLVFSFRRWKEATLAQQCAQYLAFNDPLTGLANRRSFVEAINRASAGGGPYSCLLLDIDNFKQVNDLRGHIVGDELLRAIGRRLGEFQSRDVTIARFAGDEFGIVIALPRAEDATQLAYRILARLREPVVNGSRVVETSVSGGIARFPDDAVCADQILRKADLALYRAKRSGRGVIVTFDRQMEAREQRSAAIVDALRQAIPNNEIVPHYQPQVDVTTGKVVGYEVLSRWKHRMLGEVSPGEFIPLAVDAGLIGALTGSVLQQACREAATWPVPLRISLNVTPSQLCDPVLPLQILAILSNTGFDPRRLELELTEDALLKNGEAALSNLRALKDQGVSLALDDFGTGYSSLHHLRLLPFDLVKIDRSYVRDIGASEKSRRIVEAIVKFTHSFEIPILAEGVETKQQADLLYAMGCDLGQGWYYGREERSSILTHARCYAAGPRKTGAAA